MDVNVDARHLRERLEHSKGLLFVLDDDLVRPGWMLPLRSLDLLRLVIRLVIDIEIVKEARIQAVAVFERQFNAREVVGSSGHVDGREELEERLPDRFEEEVTEVVLGDLESHGSELRALSGRGRLDLVNGPKEDLGLGTLVLVVTTFLLRLLRSHSSLLGSGSSHERKLMCESVASADLRVPKAEGTHEPFAGKSGGSQGLSRDSQLEKHGSRGHPSRLSGT